MHWTAAVTIGGLTLFTLSGSADFKHSIPIPHAPVPIVAFSSGSNGGATLVVATIDGSGVTHYDGAAGRHHDGHAGHHHNSGHIHATATMARHA